MKNIFPIIVLVAAIVAGYFLLHHKMPNEPQMVTPEPAGDPTFAWEYAPFDKGEFPYVTMSLA